MLFKTHLAFSIVIVLFLLRFELGIAFYVVFLIASIIPDIDSPNSKIGKRFKFLGLIFNHRGFFHSILALFLFSFLIYFFDFNLALAFFLGYSLHLLIDSFTKQGIYLFFPLSLKKSKGNIKVGSLLEKIIFMMLLFFAIALFLFSLRNSLLI